MSGEGARQIDIGNGVAIELYTLHGAGGTPYPQPSGLIEYHDCGGRRRGGQVAFEGRAPNGTTPPLWRIVSSEPLTLEPSILCPDCGHHGWIRGGRWVPA
jgi:hypothetical protein